MTDQPTEGQPTADDIVDEGAVSEEHPTAAAVEPAAVAAAAAAPTKVAPAAARNGRVEPPYVAAAKARKRVPLWAVPIFPLLLLWGIVYVNTMQVPVNNNTPEAKGQAIYSKNCSGCHGATGGGGTGPAFAGGAVLKTFSKWQDQVHWVNVGSANWPSKTYGDTKKPVGNGGMPGFGPQGNVSSLSCTDIALAVYYERVQLGGAQPTDKAEADLATLATDIAAGKTPAVENCPLTK